MFHGECRRYFTNACQHACVYPYTYVHIWWDFYPRTPRPLFVPTPSTFRKVKSISLGLGPSYDCRRMLAWDERTVPSSPCSLIFTSRLLNVLGQIAIPVPSRSPKQEIGSWLLRSLRLEEYLVTCRIILTLCCLALCSLVINRCLALLPGSKSLPSHRSF